MFVAGTQQPTRRRRTLGMFGLRVKEGMSSLFLITEFGRTDRRSQ